MHQAVKFVEGSEDTLRILGVPFGGPFIGREGLGSDLDGERFNKDTNLCLDWFPNDRPLLYNHGHDDKTEVAPVGRFASETVTKDVDGWWLNAQLDSSNSYFDTLKELVRQGKLYASSGAMGHLVKKSRNGDILRWPLVEVSLTPTPSNLFASVGFDDVVKHYKSAGITFDVLSEADEVLTDMRTQLKTLMESNDTSGGALVPEQTLSGDAVEKKKTDDDEDDDGESDPPAAPKVKTPERLSSFKELFDYYYTHPEEVQEVLDRVGGSSSPAKAVETPLKGVFALRSKDALLLLVPGDKSDTAPAVQASKDGEIIAMGGLWGDPPEGSVEDWLSDLTCCLNRGVFGPLNSSGYVNLLATFGYNGPGFAIACVRTYDPTWTECDEQYFRVDFDAENDEPIIKGFAPYSAVYVPTDQLPANVYGQADDDPMEKSVTPLISHGDFVLQVAKAFSTRTKDVMERRTKEGRVLSSANRTRINNLVQQLKDGLGDLQGLLDETAPAEAEAGKSRVVREMEMILLQHEADTLLRERS